MGDGHSNMKVMYMWLLERKVWAFGIRVCWKKGINQCALSQNGVFLVWTPKNVDESVCQKCNFLSKICKFYVKIATKLTNFLNCENLLEHWYVQVLYTTYVPVSGTIKHTLVSN